ncbi:MAG: carboxypeptidase M32 [Verrucomicrobiota bacterium]
MPAAYDQLVAKLKRAHTLGTVADLLGWDEQVNLPADSADVRAMQHAVMAETHHAAATDLEIGRLLTELETPSTAFAADELVTVRHARRDYDRATKLPADFIAEKAAHSSRSFHAWADAKKRADFASFAPFLEKQLALARREADLLGWGDRPYDYAIDRHDPGLTAAQITALFTELKRGLVPLVRDIRASEVRARTGLFQGFPVEAQRAFLREVTERLGFNYRRGRIDVSLHPFCSGTGADIRMTTRFDADNPLDSLFSSIHETGHGMYEQGLPLVHLGTALGQSVGMAVHESQSRLWENQVARSRAFWKFFEPRFRALFPVQLAAVPSDALYLAVNAVEPTLIRVDSDEVHYNLHILLRFELEQRLFSGTLAVRDLPIAWNALSAELLGQTPANDREGVLQDVHWSGGGFGYFPSYCLGNMFAAQLWATTQRTLPGLEADFARGDFSRLLNWLRENIHTQGRRHGTLALVRRVTGEELSPKHLLAYLQERYGGLYLG